jgi:hypothetical protein
MRKIAVFAFLSTLIAAACLPAQAYEPMHTKIMPHSIEYPLISPMPYPSATGDPYQGSFGVRRVFKSVVGKDYVDTLLESIEFHRLYGGYGVLGHGEDVFTDRAARYRRSHQGK